MVANFKEMNTLSKMMRTLNKTMLQFFKVLNKMCGCLSDYMESYVVYGILENGGLLTSWCKVPPGDNRFRAAIGHADQGHIAALIHSDIRGDVRDLWWNCKDKSKWNMQSHEQKQACSPGPCN